MPTPVFGFELASRRLYKVGRVGTDPGSFDGGASAGKLTFFLGRNVSTSKSALRFTDKTPTSPGTAYIYKEMGSVALSLNAIAFGAGLFVAVGTDGVLFTSPDGGVWTSRTSGTGFALNRVVFGASIFVAGGATQVDLCLISSPDGINWTDRTTPGSGGGPCLGLAYSRELGLFVAMIPGPVNSIFTSTDGITWAGRTLPLTPSVGSSGDVVWVTELELFIATVRVSTGNLAIFKSEDGNDWVTVANVAPTGGASSMEPKGVAFANGVCLVVGSRNTAQITCVLFKSTDGVNWTDLTDVAIFKDTGATVGASVISLNAAKAGPGLFYLMRQLSGSVSTGYTTADGLELTPIDATLSGFSPNALDYIGTGVIYRGTLRTEKLFPAGEFGLCQFRRIGLRIMRSGSFTVTLKVFVDGQRTQIYSSESELIDQVIVFTRDADVDEPESTLLEADINEVGTYVEVEMTVESNSVSGIFLPEEIDLSFRPVRQSRQTVAAESQ